MCIKNLGEYYKNFKIICDKTFIAQWNSCLQWESIKLSTFIQRHIISGELGLDWDGIQHTWLSRCHWFKWHMLTDPFSRDLDFVNSCRLKSGMRVGFRQWVEWDIFWKCQKSFFSAVVGYIPVTEKGRCIHASIPLFHKSSTDKPAVCDEMRDGNTRFVQWKRQLYAGEIAI